MPGYFWAGQIHCYDINDAEVSCKATGIGFKKKDIFHLLPVASTFHELR
jgi:hypothetical protein